MSLIIKVKIQVKTSKERHSKFYPLEFENFTLLLRKYKEYFNLVIKYGFSTILILTCNAGEIEKLEETGS